MTDFVLDEDRFKEDNYTRVLKITNYAKFIKQPLHIRMFIPCDKNNEPLRKPMYDPANEQYWASAHFEYEKAKEQILFEGWYLKETYAQHRNGLAIDDEICKENTMEELIMNGYDLYLTPYAIKQIGL